MATIDEFISTYLTNIETSKTSRGNITTITSEIPGAVFVDDFNIVAVFQRSTRLGETEIIPITKEAEEPKPILPDVSFERNERDVIRRVNNTGARARSSVLTTESTITTFDSRIETVVPEIERSSEDTPQPAVKIDEALTDDLLEPVRLEITQINQPVTTQVFDVGEIQQTDAEEQNLSFELQDTVVSTVSQEVESQAVLLAVQGAVGDLLALQEELSLSIQATLEGVEDSVTAFDPNTSLFAPPDADYQSIEEALLADQQSNTVQDSGGDSGGDFSFSGYDYGGGGG